MGLGHEHAKTRAMRRAPLLCACAIVAFVCGPAAAAPPMGAAAAAPPNAGPVRPEAGSPAGPSSSTPQSVLTNTGPRTLPRASGGSQLRVDGGLFDIEVNAPARSGSGTGPASAMPAPAVALPSIPAMPAGREVESLLVTSRAAPPADSARVENGAIVLGNSSGPGQGEASTSPGSAANNSPPVGSGPSVHTADKSKDPPPPPAPPPPPPPPPPAAGNGNGNGNGGSAGNGGGNGNQPPGDPCGSGNGNPCGGNNGNGGDQGNAGGTPREGSVDTPCLGGYPLRSALFLSSSMAEHPAVNRRVVGSNPT